MFKFKSAFLFSFLGFVSLNASASNETLFANTEAVSIPGMGTLPYKFLFSAKSNIGESIDEFALRISPQLRAYTKETSYEACGVIATNGVTYSVSVGSNLSHAFCATSKYFTEQGTQLAGMTIHSHPVAATYIVNKQDQALIGRFERVGSRYNTGNAKRLFSKEDFASGAGYLVSPFGELYKQSGSMKTVEKVEHGQYLAQTR